MRLTSQEKEIRREIEEWQHADRSVLTQALDWSMRPVDWAVDQVAGPEAIDRTSEKIGQFLSVLNDASEWTYDYSDVVDAAHERGLKIETVNELRHESIEDLDPLARRQFTQNAVLAAIEGGGTGLGGAALIAADVPLLFTINLRLIQQIGACYGFPMRGPSYRPLVLSVFNVAASGSAKARNEALREVSVAASAFARDTEYKGRVSGTFRDQNRHLPREIAKNLVSRKIGQTIPIAGAAVGAGVNYWFTRETSEAAYMLSRALYLEWKERL